MTLPSGTRLGPYEILAPLGAGGMGEVYRAHDTRLVREVAIKVLPDEFVPDASRLKRFEIEARAASALNHPNIVTVYDIGTSNSISYIAMERVEGETLRKLIEGGLRLRRMLSIAAQIGDGLAKAHEVGIVHRDLKPENVMVTKEGLVKILDFGLAKLTRAGVGSDEGAYLLTESLTGPGVLMGTIGYMSPEHASGGVLDFRSDQFAFGSILYEMVSGKRAFQKKTGVETLASILNEDPPPLSAAAPNAPAPLRWIVERCLAKSPGERYAATRDLARDLATLKDHVADISSDGLRPVSPASRAPARRGRRGALLGALGIVAVGAGVLLAPWLKRSGREELPTWSQVGFRRGVVWSGRFAPDGQTIVYSASWDSDPMRLFSTRPGSSETRTLDLPPAKLLAISPSSEIAFLRDPRFFTFSYQPGTLVRAGLEGGTGRDVLENVVTADWSPDGTQLAVARDVGGKTRLEYPLGKKIYETDQRISNLRISRDGNWIAFMQQGISVVAVRALDGLKRVLWEGEFSGASGLAWSADGREIWFTPQKQVRDSSPPLMAVTLSGKHREIVRGPGQLRLYDIAPDGRLLLARWDLRVGVRGSSPSLVRERELSATDDSVLSDLSSDGRTVLFYDRNALFLRATDGSPPVRLSETVRDAHLSPDGKSVVAISSEGGGEYPVLVPVGAGEVRRIGRAECDGVGWFSDGKRILCKTPDPKGGLRLVVLEISSGKLTVIPIPEAAADLNVYDVVLVSPDGMFLAGTGRGGDFLIVPIAGGAARRISVAPAGLDGETRLVGWTSDGQHLFVNPVFDVPNKVQRLDLASGTLEPWRELTLEDLSGVVRIRPIQVAPDGRSWAYTYIRVLSNLYVVEGLK
ncbi:MAG: protein kinase [Acidobacteriota bacterium]